MAFTATIKRRTFFSSAATNTKVGIVSPPGSVAGDLMLLAITLPAGQTLTTTGTSWTFIRSDTNAAAATTYLYWGVNGTAQSITAGFSWPSCNFAVEVVGFSGVDTVTPINIHGGTASAVGSTTINAPSVTTTVANTMLVTFAGGDAAVSTLNTWTKPASETLTASAGQNVASVSATAGAAYETVAAAGATGAKLWTASGSLSSLTAASVALNPGSTIPSTPSLRNSGAAAITGHTASATGDVLINSNVAIGDLLVVSINTGTVQAITPPAGWAQIGGYDTGGGGQSSIWWKVATATEVASAVAGTLTVFTLAAAANVITYIAYWTDVFTTTPIQTVTAWVNTAGGTTETAPSLTTTVSNEYLLMLCLSSSNLAVSVTSSPGYATGAGFGSTFGTINARFAPAPTAGVVASSLVTWSGANTSDAIVIAVNPTTQFTSSPALTSPAASAYVDLGGGTAGDRTMSWTFASPNLETQAGFAFRRKLGAGAYEWYNVGAGTWGGTEFLNASATSSITFPAAKWTDQTTGYVWSVATYGTVGGTSLLGAYAPDRAVNASANVVAVVTAPTGVDSTVSRPPITWTYTQAQGYTQASYRAIIYTAAQAAVGGFTVGVSPSTYDSGVVASAALTVTPTVDLPNNTSYVTYVILVANTSSQSTTSSPVAFSTAYSPPNAPTLSAVYSAVTARVTLTVGYGANIGLYNTTNTVLALEYQDAGTLTWTAPRGVVNPTAFGGTIACFDYEAPPGVVRTYRATATGTAAGNVLASTTTSPVTAAPTSWWLKDPTDATVNQPINVNQPPKTSRTEQSGVFYPLGRTRPIVVADAMTGADGSVNILTLTAAAYTGLLALLNRQRVLFLESPFGESWYVRLTNSRDTTLQRSAAAAPYRQTSVTYVETDAP